MFAGTPRNLQLIVGAFVRWGWGRSGWEGRNVKDNTNNQAGKGVLKPST